MTCLEEVGFVPKYGHKVGLGFALLVAIEHIAITTKKESRTVLFGTFSLEREMSREGMGLSGLCRGKLEVPVEH